MEYEPIENFEEGQWWLSELDALKGDDQKRAVAVVRSLMRSAKHAAEEIADLKRKSGNYPSYYQTIAELDSEIERLNAELKERAFFLVNEVEKVCELTDEVERINTLVSMKDEALDNIRWHRKLGGAPTQYQYEVEVMASKALSATSETVSAWQSKRDNKILTKALEDTKRLNWLISNGAYISHSYDGDTCNVWFSYDPEDEQNGTVPVEGYPQKVYIDPRTAIDSVMASELRAKGE